MARVNEAPEHIKEVLTESGEQGSATNLLAYSHHSSQAGLQAGRLRICLYPGRKPTALNDVSTQHVLSKQFWFE